MKHTPNHLVRSATLPARANLEHLRNEAKQQLKTMRSQRPAARLSEAQLLVARSYGFPSCRKLKSYVDALNAFMVARSIEISIEVSMHHSQS